MTQKQFSSIRLILILLVVTELIYIVKCNEKLEEVLNDVTETSTNNPDGELGAISTDINYTDYTPNNEYLSEKNAHFSAGVMAGMYRLTERFIKSFMPDDILMEGLIISNGTGKVDISKDISVSDLTRYYSRLAAVVGVMLVLALLFPLFGLFVCCCRCCCGQCGSKAKPVKDKSGDLCWKSVEAVVLVVLLTGLVICAVGAFGSNGNLHDGVGTITKNLNDSLSDTKTFLGNIEGHVSMLLGKNYKEFSTEFKETLTRSSDTVMSGIERLSNASVIDDLEAFGDQLPKIQELLGEMGTKTAELINNVDNLANGLKKLGQDLTKTLKDCINVSPQCKAIAGDTAKLQVTVDTSKLPDLSQPLKELNAIHIDLVQEEILKGRRSLNDLKENIHIQMEEYLNQATDKIDDGGATARDIAEKINKPIDDIRTKLTNGTDDKLADIQSSYIDKYESYRYYVGLVFNLFLLAIVVCLMLGIIFGIFGARPNPRGSSCCNKETGSNFLIAAVAIMFLTGFFFALLSSIGILVGSVSQSGICATLRHTNSDEKSQIMDIIDDQLNFGLNETFSEMIQKCHKNESAYKVFNLDEKFNVTELKDKFNVEEMLSKIDVHIDWDSFKILVKTDKLNELKSIDVSVNVEDISSQLEGELTGISLEDFSRSLQELIDTSQGPLKQELDKQQKSLTDCKNILLSVKQSANEFIDLAKNLDQMAKMNHTSFTEAVTDMLQKIEDAQTKLQTDGPQILKQIIDDFKKAVNRQVGGYRDRVIDTTTEELARCGPLSNVYNATLVAVCDKVILPWSTMWFSFYWAVIFFVFAIINCIMLASLYQKYQAVDPYDPRSNNNHPAAKSYYY